MRALLISSLLLLASSCFAEEFCNINNECINLSSAAIHFIQTIQDNQQNEEKSDELTANKKHTLERIINSGEGSGGL